VAAYAPSAIDLSARPGAAIMRTPQRSVAKDTPMRDQGTPPFRSARARALARAATLTLLALLTLPATGAGAPARRAPKPPPFLHAINTLRAAGTISASAADSYRHTYSEALRTRSRLHGTGGEELSAAIAGLEAIAAGGSLQAPLLHSAALTLERNLQWWPHHPAPAYGTDLTLPGTYLIFERYPGHGLQIQWLATFGRANGYYQDGQTGALAALLREALAMAIPAAGGISWDYLFPFDSGAPPWRSALTQATALEALARAYQRTHEAPFLEAADAALRLFQAPPPEGVRTSLAAGPWYAQYTFAPEDHIINGFIQALVGLYEYTQITGSPSGAALFAEGDATARALLPGFNTGAWSRYDQHHESDLSYHDLLTEFLAHLCTLTSAGEPLAHFEYERALQARKSAGGSASTPAPRPPAPIPGDQLYCETASQLHADLHTPPRLALLTHSLTAAAAQRVAFSLSKIATLSYTITRAGHTYLAGWLQAEAGRRSLLWKVPAQPGAYTLRLRAIDLAGNHSALTEQLQVRAPKRPHRPARART